MSEHRPETVAIHAGRPARVEGEPLNPPLVPVSNFYEAGYPREQGSPGWAPFETAKSLGGVESLIERRAPGLLRLSVGCEHVEDLWDDLEQAL